MPWKTHINNAPVESQKYMSKCQFTLHTTVENQKARGNRMRETEMLFAMKCCCLFLSFQKAKIITILPNSNPMDLFVSWIVSFLFMAFPKFYHLPCLQCLTVEAETSFLCGAIARVAIYYEHDPTTHLAVHYITEACYLIVWGKVLRKSS